MRLGLIGDNIAASSAPRLHRLAGELAGVDVTYDRLVPQDMQMEFDALFDHCATSGYRGLNITYPYKVRAAGRAESPDPLVRAMSAVNTILFEADGPKGYNTDHSGFIRAIRLGLGDRNPGAVALAGAGGVGAAMAFGLVALGASEIRITDTDPARSEALMRALEHVAQATILRAASSVAEAAEGADGLLNATPIGMVGYPGCVYAEDDIRRATWAFDAIYTPRETQFIMKARTLGLTVIEGYELFFHQGIDAWTLFHGTAPDAEALRTALLRTGPA